MIEKSDKGMNTMEQYIEEFALLVAVNEDDNSHFDYEMEELRNLTEALQVEVVGEVTQNLPRIHPTTYVGKGKLDEIKRMYEAINANLIITNDELSPSQIRNLEEELQCKIIDRTMLILDIFARRAKTHEARMQVELAQLQYFLPRLVGLRSSLSRQGGGTGGGFQNKGAGETKLELDRRVIEDQIAKLNRNLRHAEEQRQTQRKRRNRSGMPVVSIVGYTNAGKSTLMNQLLTNIYGEEAKEVFEKDMLFATLDTSVRKVELPNNRKFILTDTVGFVSKLPHHLVKAFRSTLEEAREADLLLHVVDVSHEEYRYMIDVTNETLLDVGVEDIPTILVYNKADVTSMPYPYVQDNEIWMSAKQGEGLDELLTLMNDYIFADYEIETVTVPYERGDLVSLLNEEAHVIETEYEEEGTQLTIEWSSRLKEQFYQAL